MIATSLTWMISQIRDLRFKIIKDTQSGNSCTIQEPAGNRIQLKWLETNVKIICKGADRAKGTSKGY